ncbi:failed axon connections-like [Mercenaria mercenaria]|uniref:failed axon connections-like n=1 Tax=Mercenaria mercenaria TaxID=6596 RepID=UPI00234F05B7|nr:failed axon connections-like [Mercenaria mercenaria]
MSQTIDPKWKEEYKKDVVYLHVIPRSRARDVVNISPFAIKLELWLRINEIPFETIDCQGFSKKGQSPFILFNGEEIPDSNFIIEYLSKYFNKNPYPNLDASEKATARAFVKMVEENTSWPIFVYRYVENIDEYADYFSTDQPMEVRKQILGKLQEWVGKRAHGHGIGRHSTGEIQQIGCDDIQAISDFLGNKKYMMGDTPTVVDCSVFGVLSQVVYVPMGYPMRKYILENCSNIIDLFDRLKNTYWTNWEEQCKM